MFAASSVRQERLQLIGLYSRMRRLDSANGAIRLCRILPLAGPCYHDNSAMLRSSSMPNLAVPPK